MRGQKMNDAQRETFARLIAKGWRGSEVGMYAKQVPMYYDRPYTGLPRPHVVHIDRKGKVRRGYCTSTKS